MLKKFARVALITYLIGPLGYSISSTATDPCQTKFKPCGRMVFSFVGDGEIPNTNRYPKGSKLYNEFNPFDYDAIERNATQHFRQFSPTSESTLPVQMVVLSSDPELEANVLNVIPNPKGTVVGVEKNNSNGIQRLLNLKSDESKINQAFAKFENDPECIKLKEYYHTQNVRPFIKGEVIIDTDSGGIDPKDPGFASFPGDLPTKDKRSRQDFLQNKSVFKKEQWKMFTEAVYGIVLESFITACRSGGIGAAFEKVTSESLCSCFIADALPNQDSYGGTGWSGSFTYAMPDHGAALEDDIKTPNYWTGAPNGFSMLPALYDKQKGFVFHDKKKDEADPREVVFARNSKNPLSGFVYTSADSVADEILSEVAKAGSVAEAKQVLEAQFTGDLPKEEEANSNNPDLRDILGSIQAVEKNYEPVLLDEGKRTDGSDYAKEIKKFVNCTYGSLVIEETGEEVIPDEVDKTAKNKTKKPTVKTLDCTILWNYLVEISKKTNRTEIESNFLASSNKFNEVRNENKIKDLMTDYYGKKVTLEEAFTRLSNVWTIYDRFYRDNVVALKLAQSGKKRSIDPKLEKVFNYATTSFEKAYGIARDQLFYELRREAISVKLAKIKRAAKFTSKLPAEDADKYLKRLLSKIRCLEKYAIGPMIDRMAPGKYEVPLYTLNGKGEYQVEHNTKKRQALPE
jgi:hypothetical protein